MTLPEPHVRAWYWYAFAAEVFAACALAMFLPITLEQMAREIGFEAPDFKTPCSSSAPAPGAEPIVCKAKILGQWVDTQTFSMYVKSAAVALQAIGIISLGPLADAPWWRKRLLIACAAVGSLSAALFTVLPAGPKSWLPPAAAGITVIANAAYAASIVCANAFLPALAREDPDVRAAKIEMEVEAEAEAAGQVRAQGGESGEEENGSRHRVSHEDEDANVEHETHALLGATTSSSTSTRAAETYAALLSSTTARLSSTGTAIGFFSGVAMLVLLLIPVTRGKGSTGSLELAVGLSGLWWAVFTVPAAHGLPGGPRTPAPSAWLAAAWARAGALLRPAEVRALPNLFMYLLAWVFLSDGFHTTTYTAILYASSTLHMGASQVVLIGLLMQLCAVVSSITAPRVQRRCGFSNLGLLVILVLLAQILPLYACLGLILPYGGLRTPAEMYVAAAWFGTLYGPFNSYARAVYAELVPPGHESTFFSLFALTDKSASFFGPMIVGAIKNSTGNIRLGFLFLTAMLALPVPILARVDVPAGSGEARVWSESRKEVREE